MASNFLRKFSLRGRKSGQKDKDQNRTDQGSALMPFNLGNFALEAGPSVVVPTQNPQVTPRHLEAELKMRVVTNKNLTSKPDMMLSLLKLKNEYIGNVEHQFIWETLIYLMAPTLVGPTQYGRLFVYRAESCKGITLLFDGPGVFELPPKLAYSQTFNWLTDGVRSEWSIEGTLISTHIPYEPKVVTEESLNYLKHMGLECYKSKENYLVLNVPKQLF